VWQQTRWLGAVNRKRGAPRRFDLRGRKQTLNESERVAVLRLCVMTEQHRNSLNNGGVPVERRNEDVFLQPGGKEGNRRHQGERGRGTQAPGRVYGKMVWVDAIGKALPLAWGNRCLRIDEGGLRATKKREKKKEERKRERGRGALITELRGCASASARGDVEKEKKSSTICT